MTAAGDPHAAHHLVRPAVSNLRVFMPAAPARPHQVHLAAANEWPFPPDPAVVEAVTRAATRLNRYPDPAAAVLSGELAEVLGVATDRVAVGAGSVALLQALFLTVNESGADAIFGWRSFEVYPTLAAVAGLRPRPIQLRDATHDLAAMAAAVSHRSRLLIVCNPNNPTGTVVPHSELARLAEVTRGRCVLVVDEAYVEFATDDADASLRLARDHDHVVVVRTFSKAFGLAGLRVGYAVGAPWLVGRLRAIGLPFAVSDLAQQAARTVLTHRPRFADALRQLRCERHRLQAELVTLGWAVPPSHANFVWLPEVAAESFRQHCAAGDVIVKAFSGEGVRVTVGTRAGNDAFLARARAWCAATARP